ncbi:Uncharacterised protein [Vibrio cholerae]|nr:Uncharacterised protein [Vibrio cholerae]
MNTSSIARFCLMVIQTVVFVHFVVIKTVLVRSMNSVCLR